ncbi:hypothetical protein GGR58DRAFT_457125 [Xylaria digitata]|nr:hypothetical protein GGR58DRAFT_457125 [Xylaria digitata]
MKTSSTLSVHEPSEDYKHLDDLEDERFMRGGSRPSSLLEEEPNYYHKAIVTNTPSAANDDIELKDIRDSKLRRLTKKVYTIMSKTKPTITIKACRDALTSGAERRVSDAVNLLNSSDGPASTVKSTRSPTLPETSPMKTKRAPRTRNRTAVACQRGDRLYIAELESKLKEKQDNEKAWATHFENLHQREKEAKAALQQQLGTIKLGNEKLQRVVQVVAGRLFEHRERLWGLSTPARKMGEELISTLEQMEVSCDEPLIYE